MVAARSRCGDARIVAMQPSAVPQRTAPLHASMAAYAPAGSQAVLGGRQLLPLPVSLCGLQPPAHTSMRNTIPATRFTAGAPRRSASPVPGATQVGYRGRAGLVAPVVGSAKVHVAEPVASSAKVHVVEAVASSAKGDCAEPANKSPQGRVASPAISRSNANDPVLSGVGGGADGARVRSEWQQASATVDEMLRGSANAILNDPGRAQCRLCQCTLTGNVVIDERVVANHRLVVAMDHAWTTCERFHEERGRLRKQAMEKRRQLEDMRRLVDDLRAEFPEQVHSYVMRSLAPVRERQVALKDELDAVHTESLSGFPGISPTAVGRAPVLYAPPPAPKLDLHPDGEWDRYCESVQARIAKIAAPEYVGRRDVVQSAPQIQQQMSLEPPVVGLPSDELG